MVNKLQTCMFYIAQYPVRWTAQSPLHWQTCSFQHQDYLLTLPPLSIARYTCIHLYSWVNGGVVENENAQTLKRQQRGFEPGLSIASSAFYRAPQATALHKDITLWF